MGEAADGRRTPGQNQDAIQGQHPAFFALTGAISPDGAFCLKIIKCG